MHWETKQLIYRIYNWLQVRQKVFGGRKNGARALCEEATGVTPSGLKGILKEVRENGELPEDRQPRVSQVNERRDRLVSLLQARVKQQNSRGIPVSSKELSRWLFEEHAEHVHRVTVCKWLRCKGLRFGKGERRNILHNTAANVAYRAAYLRRRFSNLNDALCPQKTEVFLDESYCHMSHIRGETWVHPSEVVYSSGRGKLLIIFGAIAVRS